MTERAHRPKRPLRSAVVTGSERIASQMVRVHFEGPDVGAIGPLEHTDSYVKILFGPHQTRTYTIRRLDPVTATMAIDFVVHGDAGIAGPWAATVQPGTRIEFRGPGGKWSPSAGTHHVLVGDESAAPAIAAALERLPASSTATAFLEVADAGSLLPLPAPPGLEVVWARRSDGTGLADVVRGADLPDDGQRWFVHGNADMVKDLRRHLFLEREVPRSDVSISGYWRTGADEDTWQATKHDYMSES